MHEREPGKDKERLWVFTDCVKEVDDAGHRAAWMDAAEVIADTEESRAFFFNDPLSRTDDRARKGGDRFEPRFLYVGDRESLAFMAETAAGIIKHGQAFAFWVREMGGRPDALDEFEKVFIGHWKSADEFTQYVLDDRAAAENTERRDDEESREDRPTDAKTWARDLQRRGEIRVVPSPLGGVWVFRGW